jgi:hypothetical protein
MTDVLTFPEVTAPADSVRGANAIPLEPVNVVIKSHRTGLSASSSS